MFKDLMSKFSQHAQAKGSDQIIAAMLLQPYTWPQSCKVPDCRMTKVLLLILHRLSSCVFSAGMQSSSLKLFPTVEQKPMLLKRQAFAMFSGEIDQYHLYLPLIQGTRLLE